MGWLNHGKNFYKFFAYRVLAAKHYSRFGKQQIAGLEPTGVVLHLVMKCYVKHLLFSKSVVVFFLNHAGLLSH
jgi:hypothetical protein